MILTYTISGFIQKNLASPGAYHALDYFSEAQGNKNSRLHLQQRNTGGP